MKPAEERLFTPSTLHNVIQGIGIGVVAVDNQFRITAYSPLIHCIFPLSASDIGKTLCSVSCYLSDGVPVNSLKQVINEGQPVEKVVVCSESDTFLLNISPISSKKNKITGLVLTFTNITAKQKRNRCLIE